MAGFFYDLTHPGDGNLSSFNVTVNDEQQCVLTKLDGEGKPCDFAIADDLDELAERIAEEAAGEDGYSLVKAIEADEYLCQELLDVGTWQEAADIMNGRDGKEKWVMYGKWFAFFPLKYLDRENGETFEVTAIGKKLDAMHANGG